MNYEKYIDLIAAEKYAEATQYKSSYIPDILYKYHWLDGGMTKNRQRFSALANGQIYLSTLQQFNDPFEGKAFIFDNDELIKKGWNKEIFQNFINQINDNARICCFANPDEKHQNMPMWAYYANNHNGFCVQYSITEKQKKFIYPVSYDQHRVKGNALIGTLINDTIDMIRKGKCSSSQMMGKLNAYNHLAFLSLTCKHISWKHEKEFRALVPSVYGKYFSATPRKIFLGMNCSPKAERRLLKIAHSFGNCEVYKMQEVLEESAFHLKEQQLV